MTFCVGIPDFAANQDPQKLFEKQSAKVTETY
jgi:hypothetical protein